MIHKLLRMTDEVKQIKAVIERNADDLMVTPMYPPRGKDRP